MSDRRTAARFSAAVRERAARLAGAGIEPSVGSVGDSWDNALAETVIGLFKTESIHPRGPWRSLDAVAFTTLEWVDWFNHRRLLEPIGSIPPAEAEARDYDMQGPYPWLPHSNPNCLRQTRSGSHARLCPAVQVSIVSAKSSHEEANHIQIQRGKFFLDGSEAKINITKLQLVTPNT